MLLLDGLGEGPVGFEQHAAIFENARREGAPASEFGFHRLRGRQSLGMLFEPLDAEQLSANRLFLVR